MSGRAYTPYAQWKFREFNELSHLFKRRLNESYETASMYIGQFPNEKVTIIARYDLPTSPSSAVLIHAQIRSFHRWVLCRGPGARLSGGPRPIRTL